METNFTPAVTTELQTKLTQITQKAEAVKVETHDDVVTATNIIKEVKEFGKYVETERTALTKPLNDTVTEINKMAKVYSIPAEQLEKELKGKILAFNEAELKKSQENEKKVQDKIKAINACNTTEELEAQAPEAGEDARINVARIARKNAIAEAARIAAGVKPSVAVEEQRIEEEAELKQAQAQVQTPAEPTAIKGVRTIKKLVILDPTLIPRAYMIPDEKKIEEALKNGAVVPGAILEDHQTLAVR